MSIKHLLILFSGFNFLSLNSIAQSSYKIDTVTTIYRSVRPSVNDPGVNITVRYPLIKGLENKTVDDKVNSIIKKVIDSQDSVFHFNDMVNEYNQGIEYRKEDSGEIYYMGDIGFEISFSSNDLLSIRFYSRIEDNEGNDDNDGYFGINIDLTTGEEYSLNDLLTGNYLSVFKKYYNDKFVVPDPDDYADVPLSFAEDFYIAHDDFASQAIVIVFLAGSGKHTMDIGIPIKDLQAYQRLINKKGPLRFLLTRSK